jgi:hypothetical protein
MNIYDFLKSFDQWFNLEVYPYNFIILVYGVFCTIIVLPLYRFNVRTKSECVIGALEETKTKNVVHLIIIVSMFTLFLISLCLSNMALQYFAIVYGLIVTLIISKFCSNRFSIVLMALLVIFFANISTAVNLGIEVGEQTSDTAIIMRNGHWERSLKASYYDIANVPSILKAILNIIVGINAPESIFTYLILTAVNLTVIALIVYLILTVIYKAKLWLILPTLVLLGSHPAINLLFSPPSISLSLSLLTIFLILKSLKEEKISRKNIFISTLAFFVSVFAHGTAVAVIAFLLIMLIVSRISFRNLLKHQTMLLRLLLLFLVIFWVRTTLPQIIEGGTFVNYLRDLVRFFTGAVSEWRSVRWSAVEVPRVTAYAWVLIVSLATVPLISAAIDKITGKSKHVLFTNYWYSALAITGVTFIGFGFIATFFSNSLGREFYFSGFMFLGISTPYALKILSEKRNAWIILCLLISLSVVFGIATPSKMPLYEPYRKLTIAWRGSDFTHCLYAMDVAPFISNTMTLKIYVKSDDTIPIDYFHLLLHGSRSPVPIINHMPEKTLYNIVFMADYNNYVGVSIP